MAATPLHDTFLELAFSPTFSLDHVWDTPDYDIRDFCAWLETPEAN